MASFAGYGLKIEADGSFFPGVEIDPSLYRDGWSGTILVESLADLNGIKARIAKVDVKRHIGSPSATYSAEFGNSYPLIIPRTAGTAQTLTAFLTEFRNLRAYGKPSGNNEQFMVDVTFLIVS